MQQNMELQSELKKMNHKFDVVLKELRDCCPKQQPMQIQPIKVSDLPISMPMGLPMGLPTAIKLADWPKEEKEFMGVGKVVETDGTSTDPIILKRNEAESQTVPQIIEQKASSQTTQTDPIIPQKVNNGSIGTSTDPIILKRNEAESQTVPQIIEQKASQTVTQPTITGEI
jgi:hypothetical protein